MQKIKNIARAAIGSALLLPQVVFAQFGLEYAANTNLGTADVRDTVFQIINALLGFLGIIAIIIVLYGGFIWMTAGGNEDKTSQARKLIFAGIIGLAIILASFAITEFVLTQLFTATGGDLNTL